MFLHQSSDPYSIFLDFFFIFFLFFIIIIVSFFCYIGNEIRIRSESLRGIIMKGRMLGRKEKDVTGKVF